MKLNVRLDLLFDKLRNITFCLEGDSKEDGMEFLWERYGKELYKTHDELNYMMQELCAYYDREMKFQKERDKLSGAYNHKEED